MTRRTKATAVVAALCAAGCAGKLQPESGCTLDCQTSTTATGTTTGAGGGSTGGSTTGGSTTGGGGGGPGVDMCIVDMVARPLKACQADGCHTGMLVSAGLDLSVVSLTTNAKTFLDRPNVGTMGVTALGDPTGCPPGAFKMIDSAEPSRSLLYLKPTPPNQMPTAPCGGKMPVIGTFTEANKACLTSWINSVIALK